MANTKASSICKAAAQGQLPDASWTCPERCFYYTMKDMYNRFRNKEITKEDGEKLRSAAERQLVIDTQDYEFSQKVLRHNAEMWKNIQLASLTYNQEKTVENADAFVRAVYSMQPSTN